MLCNLSVDAARIGSPCFVVTVETTYLPGYIKAASIVGLSSHNESFAIFPCSTSMTLIITPLASDLFTINPVLLKLSTNIL